MMKKISIWMLAAILTCSLSMTLASCSEDNDEPVVEPTPETPTTPSAVDNCEWPFDDSFMDKSVKVSDDFFMYCNGNWWKETNAPKAEEDGDENIYRRDNEMVPSFFDRINEIDAKNEVLKKLKTDAQNMDENTGQAVATFFGVLDKSGLMKATTKDEVLRAIGKMTAMGVATPFQLDPFCHQGKICMILYPRSKEDCATGLEFSSSRILSFQKMLTAHPELASHVVPLEGRATRSIPDRYPALKTIVESIGFDPQNVYMFDDYAALKNSVEIGHVTEEDIKMITDALKLWETCSFEEAKALALDYESVDSAFFSTDYLRRTSEMISKEKGTVMVVTTDALISKLKTKYLAYQRSKATADELVSPALKSHFCEAAEELRKVFAQRIQDNDWMSEGSKKNALDKLNNMIFNIGYPDQWLTEGLPDIKNCQSLVEDIYTIRKSYVDLMKAIIGKDAKTYYFHAMISDDESGLYVSNAFYVPFSNSLNILPFSMLPPYFKATQNNALNYASYNTIGHEMTHGFDLNGAKYDKFGGVGSIWANAADEAEFKRRAALLVQYFSSLDVLPDLMPGAKANGEATITENIADLGGTEIAYQAYLNRLKADGFNGDQLKLQKQRFFRGYADEYRSKYGKEYVNLNVYGIKLDGSKIKPDSHSMNKERVNGVVSNMDGWYDAFDIKDGALFRAPAERIHIW